MKKRTYSLTNKAVTDLEEIWLYTYDSWSTEQADRYYHLLIAEIEYICSHTDSGKQMDHIAKGYQAAKVKSHFIFYRLPDKNNIEVIRILHERMDVEKRLGE